MSVYNCTRERERVRERQREEHSVLPVAGQRWAAVGVEGVQEEAEEEEGAPACL